MSRIESASRRRGHARWTTHSLTADETYTVYAAGYDQYGNYISDQSVTWTGTGVCSGNLSPTTGTSTTFTAAAGGDGDHHRPTTPRPRMMTTGTITVNPGAAASFVVTTEHSGTETAGDFLQRDPDGEVTASTATRSPDYTGAHSASPGTGARRTDRAARRPPSRPTAIGPLPMAPPP